jgi:hypothetical protein
MLHWSDNAMYRESLKRPMTKLLSERRGARQAYVWSATQLWDELGSLSSRAKSDPERGNAAGVFSSLKRTLVPTLQHAIESEVLEQQGNVYWPADDESSRRE